MLLKKKKRSVQMTIFLLMKGEDKVKIHVVQENETLWTISQKYGVSLDSIIAANTHLANPDMIMPGMKITIPGSTGSKKQQQQDISKKQQQAQPQPQPQPLPQQPMQPAKKDKKQQWLPDIKEDDDKKWEALKKEMPSLPLTFHTKDSMMPTKNKDYDKEANLQKQQAYLKPAQSKKEPKEQLDLKPSKHSKPSIPTPKTPSYTQPIAETPKQHQMPQQQPMQPQLPQQPTVHQPVYQPDWCGQQPMWQHSHYDPCMQPYHTTHTMPHHLAHQHFGHMPQQGFGWSQEQVPQVFSPGQQATSWGQGQMPQDITQNQQITNWGQGYMPSGNQQSMQGFPTQPNLPGQMQGFGGMNSMQSPYGMNQPNVQQQPFTNMPNRDDCGCGE